jgi:hypothetical protein
MSRKKDTCPICLSPFFLEGAAIFARKKRRYSLYTRGKIGLTLCLLPIPLFNAPDEVSKPKQICHTKGCATGCKLDAGIRGSQIGPGCRERPDTIWRLVKSDTILPPVVSVTEQFKLLAVQRMEGMSHRENSFRKRGRRGS